MRYEGKSEAAVQHKARVSLFFPKRYVVTPKSEVVVFFQHDCFVLHFKNKIFFH